MEKSKVRQVAGSGRKRKEGGRHTFTLRNINETTHNCVGA